MAIEHRQLIAYNDKDEYTTHIEYHGHELIADEPEDIGGNNRGADPFGLILAGLASCIAITLRMYIQRKEMKVNRIALDVTMNKEKEIHVDMEIDGDVDDKQRERLGQIANMCPVHKFLMSEAKITKKMY